MSFKEAIEKVGIKEKSIIDWRDAKLVSSSGEENTRYKGYIILTKDRLIFVSEKGFLKSIKKMYDMPVSKIKKISKFPLSKNFMVFANVADKKSGFFKKMFSGRNAQIKLSNGKSFFDKVRKLNPNIK